MLFSNRTFFRRLVVRLVSMSPSPPTKHPLSQVMLDVAPEGVLAILRKFGRIDEAQRHLQRRFSRRGSLNVLSELLSCLCYQKKYAEALMNIRLLKSSFTHPYLEKTQLLLEGMVICKAEKMDTDAVETFKLQSKRFLEREFDLDIFYVAVGVHMKVGGSEDDAAVFLLGTLPLEDPEYVSQICDYRALKHLVALANTHGGVDTLQLQRQYTLMDPYVAPGFNVDFFKKYPDERDLLLFCIERKRNPELYELAQSRGIDSDAARAVHASNTLLDWLRRIQEKKSGAAAPSQDDESNPGLASQPQSGV